MRVAQRFLSLLQNFSGPFLRFFHGEKVIFHLSGKFHFDPWTRK